MYQSQSTSCRSDLHFHCIQNPTYIKVWVNKEDMYYKILTFHHETITQGRSWYSSKAKNPTDRRWFVVDIRIRQTTQKRGRLLG